MEEKMIAPCGMNCELCVSYLALKNDINKKGFRKKYCAGCRTDHKSCNLKRQCKQLESGTIQFCYECVEFPCKQLIALDRRYHLKYHMSMIDNLQYIKAHDIEQFLKKEEIKWQCPDCGDMICCHNGICLHCNLDKLLQNKKYRWEEQ